MFSHLKIVKWLLIVRMNLSYKLAHVDSNVRKNVEHLYQELYLFFQAIETLPTNHKTKMKSTGTSPLAKGYDFDESHPAAPRDFECTPTSSSCIGKSDMMLIPNSQEDDLPRPRPNQLLSSSREELNHYPHQLPLHRGHDLRPSPSYSQDPSLSVRGNSSHGHSSTFESFCQTTSLHGWKFLSSEENVNLNFPLLLGWMLVVLGSIGVAVFFLSNSIIDFRSSTVQTTQDTSR